jgi:hypothetical protein
MEAGERIEAEDTYKTPLSIFDVIRMQKLSNETSAVVDREKESSTVLKEKEQVHKEFFFPLHLWF